MIKKKKLEQEKEQIECDYEDFENKLKNIEKQIKEMQLIETFNKLDSRKYWSYTTNIEMYGSSYLNVLNQELFELALRLNEAYIIKNSKQIVENLKVFLPDSEFSHICQKFYDSTEMYNKDKQKGIKNLWNTLFLCFPVVTTTLDSFSKRCFHLLPEYIDLELIDESGQILPHNLVPALYRGRKAIIVGDVNQIEPIYSTRHNFDKYQKMIGAKFSNIKIDDSSAQLLANINTDILSKGEPIILNDHYRCEENIINFSNQNVYNKKLKLHKKDDMDKPFLITWYY